MGWQREVFPSAVTSHASALGAKHCAVCPRSSVGATRLFHSSNSKITFQFWLTVPRSFVRHQFSAGQRSHAIVIQSVHVSSTLYTGRDTAQSVQGIHVCKIIHLCLEYSRLSLYVLVLNVGGGLCVPCCLVPWATLYTGCSCYHNLPDFVVFM